MQGKVTTMALKIDQKPTETRKIKSKPRVLKIKTTTI